MHLFCKYVHNNVKNMFVICLVIKSRELVLSLSLNNYFIRTKTSISTGHPFRFFQVTGINYLTADIEIEQNLANLRKIFL